MVIRFFYGAIKILVMPASYDSLNHCIAKDAQRYSRFFTESLAAHQQGRRHPAHLQRRPLFLEGVAQLAEEAVVVADLLEQGLVAILIGDEAHRGAHRVGKVIDGGKALEGAAVAGDAVG